jgi:hypothetical protein
MVDQWVIKYICFRAVIAGVSKMGRSCSVLSCWGYRTVPAFGVRKMTQSVLLGIVHNQGTLDGKLETHQLFPIFIISWNLDPILMPFFWFTDCLVERSCSGNKNQVMMMSPGNFTLIPKEYRFLGHRSVACCCYKVGTQDRLHVW